jgi:hypothetical protein
MSKFRGKIGYVITEETVPGVWNEVPKERTLRGDVISDARILQNGGQVNDNIKLSNSISVVADAYAKQNFHAIRYVVWNGVKWKAVSVNASRYPRLIITLGGLYNE